MANKITIPADLILTAHGHTVPVGDIAPAGLTYLLLNGFSQSLTDAGTTASARTRDAAIKAANEERGKGREMTKAETAEFISTDAIKGIMESAATDARTKRLSAILDGTMVYGARGPNGPRRSPKDQFIWDCAEADANALAKSKGKTMPKDRDEASAIIQRFVDKKGAEYAARYAATSADDADLGDLFA